MAALWQYLCLESLIQELILTDSDSGWKKLVLRLKDSLSVALFVWVCVSENLLDDCLFDVLIQRDLIPCSLGVSQVLSFDGRIAGCTDHLRGLVREMIVKLCTRYLNIERFWLVVLTLIHRDSLSASILKL